MKQICIYETNKSIINNHSWVNKSLTGSRSSGKIAKGTILTDSPFHRIFIMVS